MIPFGKQQEILRDLSTSSPEGPDTGPGTLWLDQKGERSWAVGDSGVVLRYDGKQWNRGSSGLGGE